MPSAGELRSGAAATADRSVNRFFEFSLLGLLASGYLAVLASRSLDAATAILAAAALLYRGLLAAGIAHWRPSQRAVAAATIAYIGFYPIDYAFFARAFIPATVHLVFFIAIIKLLTAVTRRDFFLLKLIAFLELLAACILSSNADFLAFLVLFLLLAVATAMSSEIQRGAERHQRAKAGAQRVGLSLAAVAVSVSAGILVLTGLLFFLLPRTARAALDHILQHRYHLAGFSNEVRLGEIGEIKKQDIPVMHVRIEPGFARAALLRWRGAALTYFDGHRWYNQGARGEILRPDADGQLTLGPWTPHEGISYKVQLNESAPDGVLFFAGSPQRVIVNTPFVLRTPANTFRLLGGAYAGLQYKAFSYLEGMQPSTVTRIREDPPAPLEYRLRESYLQLPVIDARVWTLAHAVTSSSPDWESKARALETYLRSSYGYTLELPRTESADPLANFLFVRKKGHCEYFASAMAVMLRAIGMPARVVTGFAGGVFNPVTGWLIVRASDAHSWVEAWVPDRGWTTFDPTPADPNSGELAGFTRLGFYLDAAEQFWQDWVLNYNLDRQILLAVNMEQSGRKLRTHGFEAFKDAAERWRVRAVSFGSRFGLALLSLLAASVLMWFFGPAVLTWWRSHRRIERARRGQAVRSDATLLYARMLRSLRNRGLEKPAWLTPAEFARVVPDPELSLLVEDITSAYNDLRFGGNREAATRLVRLIDHLEARR